MQNTLRFILYIFCLNSTCYFSALYAEEFKDPINITLVSEQESVQPDHPFWLMIQMKMEPHWHAYWKNPGDAGSAPNVKWQLPEGFKVETVLWPTPQRFNLDDAIGFGYEKNVLLLVKIGVPKNLVEKEVTIAGEASWVACSETSCMPGRASLKLDLPVNSQSPHLLTKNTNLFAEARAQMPQSYESAPAFRNRDSVELLLDQDYFQQRHVERVEYFPEESLGIDSKILPLIETDAEGQQTVVLKESSPASFLKGVLVLHTDAGKTSYNVNVPIIDHNDYELAIGMTQHAPGTLPPKPPIHLSSSADRFAFQGGLALALVFAFLGGLILNLMPCVLPVISFKILSFIKLAGQSRKLIFEHGLAFSLGVLLSFWTLAGVLLILQAYGRAVGWGFQLQEPIFVGTLAAFLFIFALSLFGVFELGTSVMSAAGQVQTSSSRHPFIGSFLSGVLATAVATPCTGPFLGTAVGYAVTLSPAKALLIFTFLGIGMSSPYLLLAGFPGLLRFLPKPGAWMETFKQLMGFFMLATVVWLIWVFSAQTNSMSVAFLVGGFFFLSLAAWIYGRWGTALCRQLTRLVATIIASGVLIIGGYIIVFASTTMSEAPGESTDKYLADKWEVFSPQRLEELRAQGIPVFVDFTAKWCLICQANHAVLITDNVSQKFASKGVVKMKADWTKNDPIIAIELKKFGRNSVPLYLLYGDVGEDDPLILPQVLSRDIVLDALDPLTTKSDLTSYK